MDKNIMGSSLQLRSTNIILFLMLISGVAITVWGFIHIEWNKSLPFENTAVVYKYLAFIVFTAFLVYLAMRLTQRNFVYAGILICFMVSIITGTLWPLFVSIWFIFASILLGNSIFLLLKIHQENIHWIIAFLVGAGAYGTVVSLFAHYPIHYQGIYGVFLAAPIIIAWKSFLKISGTLLEWAKVKYDDSYHVDWLGLSITVVALIYFVVALMPEKSSDALVMHLFVPAQLALNHNWIFDANTYVWAVMPMLADWIFAIAYMFGGEIAARLVNVGFIFILCLLIRELIIWAGGNKSGAKWAALIFLSTPLTLTEASTLFVESVWASFLIGGLLVLLYLFTDRKNQKIYLYTAGILLGCALATKMISVTMLAVLLLVLIVKYKVWLRKETYFWILAGVTLFLLVSGIPYMKAWLVTGNPVFPFYNDIFKSPYFPLWRFNNPIYNSGISWDILYKMVFNSSKYLEAGPGVSGFQWLILFFPSVFILLRNRNINAIIILVIAILTATIVFQFQSYLRYIFPSFLLLTVILGVFFSWVSLKLHEEKKIIYIISSMVIVLNVFFIAAGTQYKDFPIYSVFSESHRDNYLENRLPIRKAVMLVNKLNKTDAPVVFFSHPYAAGLKANALHPNWYNHTFQTLVNNTNTDRAMADLLRAKGIGFIVLDTYWGTSEKRSIVNNVTEEISSFGNGLISVRKLRKEYKKIYRIQSELLKNPDFSSLDGWVVSPDAEYKPEGSLVVTAKSPASQAVPVIPGHQYIYTIKTRCYNQPTSGRFQINWLDANFKGIGPVITVFECTKSLSEQSIKLVAPENAAFAGVYASGHTDLPIVFDEVHFSND